MDPLKYDDDFVPVPQKVDGDAPFMFSNLPLHLREHTIGFLSVQDVKQFRQVSKQCAEDGYQPLCKYLGLGQLTKDCPTYGQVLQKYFVDQGRQQKPWQRKMDKVCCNGRGMPVYFLVATIAMTLIALMCTNVIPVWRLVG